MAAILQTAEAQRGARGKTEPSGRPDTVADDGVKTEVGCPQITDVSCLTSVVISIDASFNFIVKEASGNKIDICATLSQ